MDFEFTFCMFFCFSLLKVYYEHLATQWLLFRFFLPKLNWMQRKMEKSHFVFEWKWHCRLWYSFDLVFNEAKKEEKFLNFVFKFGASSVFILAMAIYIHTQPLGLILHSSNWIFFWVTQSTQFTHPLSFSLSICKLWFFAWDKNLGLWNKKHIKSEK